MAQQKEVDRNYAAFSQMLPELTAEHGETFALMKGGRVLGFFKNAEEARTYAVASIEDGLYSIQFVSREPIDLGFFTFAVPVG